MTTRTLQLIGLGVVLSSVAAIIVLSPKPKKAPAPLTIGQVARLDRDKADKVANSPQGKAAYNEFINHWKDNPDKHVQDEVGAARIRLAYVDAKDRNWEEARKTFKQAAVEYKGTGTMGADFGGIKDQALYQAAVCLNGEGKKAEYRAALVDFIKTQPMSPLVHAAYKRLVMLDGKATPEVDALLQGAINKQQKQVRFETSVCGPKCIVKILELAKASPVPDYKEIAKECGTTDSGTTIDGMRKALKAHGQEFFGFELARADLPKIATPAIFYATDHYLVVTKVKGQLVTAYDPMTEKERDIDFSKVTDDKFNPVFLLKEPPASLRN